GRKSDHGQASQSRPAFRRPLVPGPDPQASELLGGPGLRHFAALRHGDGRRHLSPRNHLALAWTEALAGGLRAAVAAAEGRPLWREPEPSPALLSVPGDPEAVAAGHPGPLSRLAPRYRRGRRQSRYPLRRGRLGEPDAWRLGARLGSVVRRHGGVAVHLFPAGR